MFSVMRVFEPEVHNVVQLRTNPLPTLFQLHHRHRSCQKTPQTAMVDNHLILSHQFYQSILVICYSKSKLKPFLDVSTPSFSTVLKIQLTGSKGPQLFIEVSLLTVLQTRRKTMRRKEVPTELSDRTVLHRRLPWAQCAGLCVVNLWMNSIIRESTMRF